MHFTGNSCSFACPFTWVWPTRSVTTQRKRPDALHYTRKTFKALNRNPLTYLSYQSNLETVVLLLTAVTPQVGLFKLVNADGVVPLWAPVWKSFEPAISGVHKLNTPFRCELDHVHLANVDPWHQVVVSCWKAAWKEDRGAKWSTERVRLTKPRVITGTLNVRLILMGREIYKCLKFTEFIQNFYRNLQIKCQGWE